MSGHSLNVNIRPMMKSDIGFALDLANQEHWDYDAVDLGRLFQLSPSGCLIAEYERAKAGWGVVSTYGSLAWIGSLVVRNSLRGRGIGAALLDHAVRYARKLGVGTVGLYSYNESVGFYEQEGFKRDCNFDHVEGLVKKVSPRSSLRQPRDIDELIEFDGRYFHGNRKLLLEALREEFPDLLISWKETDNLGYVAAKNFSDGTAEIGPWVCDVSRTDAAEQLFASELSQLSSRKISLTIPSENLVAHHIIRKHGFRIKQKVTRMFVGNARDLPRIDGIYAAAGLDVG